MLATKRTLTLLLIFGCLTTVPVVLNAQTSRAEALVVCDALQTQPKTAYGFAKAALASLWYARNAAARSSELIPEKGDDATPVETLTSMLRAIKNSTNDFVCAKRAVQPFTGNKSDEAVNVAAKYFVMVYTAHIEVNSRGIALLKKINSPDAENVAVTFADEISTLQVERGQRWADLNLPTALTLMRLLDTRPTDEAGNFLPDTKENRENGKSMRYTITKAQKKELLDWLAGHFREFVESPEKEWSAPAQMAHRYVNFLGGKRLCSDEWVSARKF
jgi:hypothetical protein